MTQLLARLTMALKGLGFLESLGMQAGGNLGTTSFPSIHHSILSPSHLILSTSISPMLQFQTTSLLRNSICCRLIKRVWVRGMYQERQNSFHRLDHGKHIESGHTQRIGRFTSGMRVLVLVLSGNGHVTITGNRVALFVWYHTSILFSA